MLLHIPCYYSIPICTSRTSSPECPEASLYAILWTLSSCKFNRTGLLVVFRLPTSSTIRAVSVMVVTPILPRVRLNNARNAVAASLAGTA
jgi:hypothetical protein